MKRRAFFGAMAVTPAIAVLTVSAKQVPSGKYGYVTVERAQKLGLLYCEVFVDGVRVEKCVAFDDMEGWADYYQSDYKGDFVIHWHDGEASVATGRVHGVVTVIRNAK